MIYTGPSCPGQRLDRTTPEQDQHLNKTMGAAAGRIGCNRHGLALVQQWRTIWREPRCPLKQKKG
jgi:hypothetical protein